MTTMKDKIWADCEQAKAKRGYIMQIPYKEIEGLEAQVVAEIENTYLDTGGASRNIVDLFCLWLKDHDIELTK